ncbi:MAG: enoyl-[acyl-carrier-protein] reductase FabK, partial [Tissierellia bacterium]|nr:enoyl-[acyl-carrier-protein] reductase FabK [Tissierellia bacterium]
AMDAEETRSAIRKCKELTDKPFGVNIMLMNPNSAEIVDVIIEEKVAVVTTGAGNPAKYLDRLHESGAKVFPVVPSVALAIRMERNGVDALIVEGSEAGGHVGEQTTMTLIPQVCDAVDIPVIAAGGIGDSRGFVAALALGASGVQIGTCLLATEECIVHERYKQAVINAKDSDTVVYGRGIKAPVRVIKNKMSRKYLELENQLDNREEMEKLTLGALKRAVYQGDIEYGSVMAGQIAGLTKEILPVKTVIENIVNGSSAVIKEIERKNGELS